MLQEGLNTVKEKNRIDKKCKKEKEQEKALCLTDHPGNRIIKHNNRVVSSQAGIKQEVTALAEVKN